MGMVLANFAQPFLEKDNGGGAKPLPSGAGDKESLFFN
jgi:hypothetical protein